MSRKKAATTERGGDIIIHRGGKKELASGCVSSCRQVDEESNKDTNNCQGTERDKASDGGGGGKGRSEAGKETKRQRETESVLVQSRMLLFIWWLLNK